jgi:DNA-binding NarL/FixJ family response regulator
MRDNAEKKARIFLIDDHPMVRRGLKQLLTQESHVICGEAGNWQEALEKIGSSGADIAILDLSLGKESGLKLIPSLQRLSIHVLVYSMHEDIETIERAFAEGADGYVCKRELEDVLFSAVSDLLSGRRHLSPRVARSLADRFLFDPEEKPEQMLSERERDVFEMLCRGESNADIAAALCISPRTVETYFYRIIAKLELSGMKELRQYAIRNISR